MPVDVPHLGQLARLNAELDRRAREARVLNNYVEGPTPLPRAIVNSNLTKAYRMLMPMSEGAWGGVPVGSSLDRLEVTGIQDGDKAAAEAAWGHWQDNMMDAESRLLNHSTLTTGRAFALVWADEDGKPEITLESSEQMIVQYREGSRRHRVAALRRWMDEDADRPMATLYRADGIFKYQGPKKASGFAGTQWEPRLVDGEEWPLENPFGKVNVVEFAINRRLVPGSFGYARGEFAHCLGLIDRINLLTFLGLVVAFWMGFPLRAVIGDKILRDDNNNPLPPFEVNADSVAQFENPNVKLAEFAAADRSNLSIYSELDQFAALTRTPRHYLPLDGGMSNIAADTIRANEGTLNAKISGDYKPSLGESYEETLRLCNVINGDPDLSPRAALQWADHQFRSLAERADAVSKFAAAQLPWTVIADLALNANADQIARWTADVMGADLGRLLTEPTTPAPAPVVA